MTDRYGECVNCRRIRPEKLLNSEGRCETCGLRETVEAAADPKVVGPHGPAKDELEDMTKAQLLAEADEMGVDVSSSNTRAEILEAIRGHVGPAGEGTETLGDKLDTKGESE